MAKDPTHHYKLLFGDMAAQLATALAENEALREMIQSQHTKKDHSTDTHDSATTTKETT